MQLDNIQFIQSNVNYSKIFRESQSSMIVSKTLKDIESILPNQFIRIHKSYIIITKFIQMINTSKKQIKLNFMDENQNIVELPIGDTYLERVRNRLLTAKN